MWCSPRFPSRIGLGFTGGFIRSPICEYNACTIADASTLFLGVSRSVFGRKRLRIYQVNGKGLLPSTFYIRDGKFVDRSEGACLPFFSSGLGTINFYQFIYRGAP